MIKQNTFHAVMSQRNPNVDTLDNFPTPPWAILRGYKAPPLLTPQFQAEPGRSSKVAPIVEHLDLGCTSNPMRVLIRLKAPLKEHSL